VGSPVGILVNTKTKRFHPIVFREAPLPGGLQPPGGGRYRSLGHHTVGFDTEAEAIEHVKTRVDWALTGRRWGWDGESVPALTEFFSVEEKVA
jgi:hypothetical protein